MQARERAARVRPEVRLTRLGECRRSNAIMNVSLQQRISEFERMLAQMRTEMARLKEPDPVLDAIATVVNEQRVVPLTEVPALVGITKSVAWQKTHELERHGRVWLRKTHAENSGHPRIMLYAPDAVVTEERRMPKAPPLPAEARPSVSPRVSVPSRESGRVAVGGRLGEAEPSPAPAVAKAGT